MARTDLFVPRAGAECCSPGWYLVDGNGCPGTAAIELNECTGENVCCSEAVDGALHDPEHEREVADEEMGTLDLLKDDRGKHGHIKRGGGKSGRKGGKRVQARLARRRRAERRRRNRRDRSKH